MLRSNFPVSDWLAKDATVKFQQEVETRVSSERREETIKNPGSSIEFGYSFAGVNRIKHTLLTEIRSFYTAHGTRPNIADIGAGFGNMTWKMLAAGGQVDAFELQAPTAAELERRVKSIGNHFWGQDKITDIFRVFVGNVLTELKSQNATEKYDFIWLGSMIHFLTPDDYQALNILLQQILKPGGRVVAEVNSIMSLQYFENYC